jgi:hypothetical protein
MGKGRFLYLETLIGVFHIRVIGLQSKLSQMVPCRTLLASNPSNGPTAGFSRGTRELICPDSKDLANVTISKRNWGIFSGFSFSFQWSPRYEWIFFSTFWHSPKLCIQYSISIVKNHHSSFVTMTYDQRATFQSIEWIHSLRYEVGCIALLWMAYVMGYTLKYLWNLPTYIEDYRPYITPGLYMDCKPLILSGACTSPRRSIAATPFSRPGSWSSCVCEWWVCGSKGNVRHHSYPESKISWFLL